MQADDHPSNAGATVVLRDAAGIRDAGSLANELRAALEAHPAVEVETGALTSVDVAVLQVLVAAHKTARAGGRALRIHAPHGGVLERVLEQSGIAASLDLPPIRDGETWTGLHYPNESAA